MSASYCYRLQRTKRRSPLNCEPLLAPYSMISVGAFLFKLFCIFDYATPTQTVTDTPNMPRPVCFMGAFYLVFK